jgi:chaperonin GroEL (HSP60 family)
VTLTADSDVRLLVQAIVRECLEIDGVTPKCVFASGLKAAVEDALETIDKSAAECVDSTSHGLYVQARCTIRAIAAAMIERGAKLETEEA